MPLEMKYFVLKPRSKDKGDIYAKASRVAMLAYADEINEHDHDLFLDLTKWVVDEENLHDNM
jgi:hypothetical protein